MSTGTNVAHIILFQFQKEKKTSNSILVHITKTLILNCQFDNKKYLLHGITNYS